MSILVAYATKHGATGQIAERIAEGLRAAGQPADARSVQEAGDLAGYQGFVIGSAIYSEHWLSDATSFVSINRDLLAQRPVWLFSSAPRWAATTGTVDLRVASEPQELRGFQVAVRPRDYRQFFGPPLAGSVSPNHRV